MSGVLYQDYLWMWISSVDLLYALTKKDGKILVAIQ